MADFWKNLLLAGVVLPGGLTDAWAGPVYEFVAGFDRGPMHPDRAALAPGADGAFYGASPEGGAHEAGCLYRVTPAGSFSVVRPFGPQSAEGTTPYGGLAADGSGGFYGTAGFGGDWGFGLVFRLDSAGNYSVLASFSGTAGDRPGSSPLGELAVDGLGNVFGTTSSGGANELGTVFRISPAGEYAVLAEFTGAAGTAPGSAPAAGPTLGADGAIYGVTSGGGGGESGTVFKVDGGGVYSVLAEFSGTAGGVPGKYPLGTLWRDGDWLYGTTLMGGTDDQGTIFRISTAGVFESLASFTGAAGGVPGKMPIAGLVKAGNGAFYGTTSQGGAGGFGSVFKYVDGVGLTQLAVFTGSGGALAGSLPQAPFRVASDGTLMAAVTGVGADLGRLIKVDPAGDQVATAGVFRGAGTNNGALQPHGGLTPGADGKLYGVSAAGGAEGHGAVYRVTLAGLTGQTASLASFTGQSGAAPGRRPMSTLLAGAGGIFRGSASAGGAADAGTLFSFNSGTNALTTFLQFTGPTGARVGTQPVSGLLPGPTEGTFVGGAVGVGSPDYGILYSARETGIVGTVAEFTGRGGLSPGMGPLGALIVSGSNYYGTTLAGGVDDQGTIYQWVRNDAEPVAFPLVFLTGSSGYAPGSQPVGAVALDESTGMLYGTARFGGTFNQGTVFRVNASTGAFTALAHLTGLGGAHPGSQPLGGIAKAHGKLYGTTSAGGAAGGGTVFRIDPASGAVTSVVSFTGGSGEAPGLSPSYATPVLLSDGNLYGTTPSGGPGGGGVVYRLRFGPTPITLAAAPVGRTTFTLKGSLNPNGEATAAFFEWGPTAALGNTTATVPIAAGSEFVEVALAVACQAPGTTVFFRVAGTNATGTQRGEILTLTTTNEPGPELCAFAGDVAAGPELVDHQLPAQRFGTTFAGAPLEKRFTILNAGNQPLEIGAFSLPAGFELSNPGSVPVSVPGGASWTVGVTLSAAGVGHFEGEAELVSNDGDESSLHIALSGDVVAAGLAQEVGFELLPNLVRRLVFHGVTGQSYVVERSTDLADWTTVSAIPAPDSGVLEITDSSAPPAEGRIFYRMRTP